MVESIHVCFSHTDGKLALKGHTDHQVRDVSRSRQRYPRRVGEEQVSPATVRNQAVFRVIFGGAKKTIDDPGPSLPEAEHPTFHKFFDELRIVLRIKAFGDGQLFHLF